MNAGKQKGLKSRFERAVALFKRHHGMLHATEAMHFGIHPATLYAMRDSGVLEPVSRGVFRLADAPPFGNSDLVTVAARVPRGVVCLISALAFYDLTTQIPHAVHLALPRGAMEPRLDFPPIKTYRFSGRAFSEGVEIHRLDGVGVRVYGVEKTLADCFKFRNKIGLDTALEAVRLYRERRQVKVADLMRFASVCRVEKVMRPYLEAIL